MKTQGKTDLEMTRQYCKNVVAQRAAHPELFLDREISVVIVKFRGGTPDLYFKKKEWLQIGGYQGFLKQFCMSILDIYEVQHKKIKESEYPTTEWDG